ncbi:MAG: VWA domain-containing protein [Deltaproteobacteria bacterium]|nr:VWA domain-containing protein [Deltaproteobacteria bacterium]
MLESAPPSALSPRRAMLGCLAALTLGGVAAGSGCQEPPTFFRLEQTDVFVQEIRRAVDVLLVVDNSCSMIDEQIKLGSNFEAFIEEFVDAEVDYQIGVTTTDMVDPLHRGRLQGETKLITADMSFEEAQTLFSENVHVCATGSGFEKGLDAARAALTEPVLSNENAGFLRENAALAIVFVSDEEDISVDPVGDYLDFFFGLKGDPSYRARDLVTMSSVVGDLPGGCEQVPPVVFDCADGLDEPDGDGIIDCADEDCASAWQCAFDVVGEADCTDGVDDDNDGAVDCFDADCGDQNVCRESECLDEEDDDGDGLTDCNDPDCLVGQPEVCGELNCFDGGFEHQNGYLNALIDCDDPSCFTNPDFEEACFNAGGRADVDYPERCDLTITFDPLTGGPIGSDGKDIDDPLSLTEELAGCEDPDCATYYLCRPGLNAEAHNECGDCNDNDLDGFEDCDDVDCAGAESCDNPYPIGAGTRYADVSLRSGGVVTSICAEEFSGIVRELGLNISGLRDAFYLSQFPRLVCPLEVRFDSQQAEPLVEGWVYDSQENRILFDADALPASGTTIFVDYTRDTLPPGQQDGAGTCGPPVGEEGEGS